ncbi:hypothetical protein METBIDRAFT_30828 [Metschnikowia bicuspidata var. bicuspidata NRRL YB-4993]|uniref:DUF3020 domain-containing protein n=1 Tax=Metschnikowia bicuspidata var. bicuspidata NRRL YB-4993 TaxID=869754 RepID=A0A1A0HCU9_9ASCO|nr:hypothetical protein METBIDRAFT_30828 [Metschnikowia bicuspidata var. bicuspidata NRRL YB-4993]OBA21805.1 hypothetical protein METBIDRAFT_30828 [Metschnikowia bicuspidata var. bicuspidata NRRL YB-4993]
MTPAHDALQHHQNSANTHFEHGPGPEDGKNGETTHSHQIGTDDLALENAIGDAFKQFAMFGEENNHDSSEHHQINSQNSAANVDGSSPLNSEPKEHSGENVAILDMDLDNVVDTLFTSLSKEDVSGSPEKTLTTDCVNADSENRTSKDSHSYEMNAGTNLGKEQDPQQLHRAQCQDLKSNLECRNLAMGNEIPARTSQSDSVFEKKTSHVSKPTNGPSDHHESQAPDSTHASIALPESESDVKYSASSRGQKSGKSHTSTPAHDLKEELSANQVSNLDSESAVIQAGPASNNGDGENLESAIGDAFKNLVPDMSPDVQTSPRITPDSSQPESEHNEGEDFDDTNLEDAIGAAFQSLAHDLGEHKKSTSNQDPNLSPLNSESWEYSGSPQRVHQPTSGNVEHELNHRHVEIDLGDIVQSVVLQIGNSDHSTDPMQLHLHLSSISKDILESLASEISNQVHTPEPSHPTGLHEDNASSHTQTLPHADSNLEQPEDLDAALKAAVANAVKSAFPGGNTLLTSVANLASEKEPDLEQSQMSEILQNAFNMAMQNPQDLLTSLDAAEELEAEISKTNGEPLTQLVTSDVTTTTLSDRKVYGKKEEPRLVAHLQKEQAALTAQKPLSIAQTLALHRSNMSTSQRDYSTIESLEDSIGPSQRAAFQPSSQNHPQLSTILSSLSQHIQSGTHSSNLMQVIRQMTNALMLNKTFPASYNKAALEAIKLIKNSPDKTYYITRLQEANRFVLSMSGDDNRRKALALLVNILISVDPRKDKSAKEDSHESSSSEPIPKKLGEDVALFYGATLSILSELDIQRLRMVMNGVKPELDSNEQKSRVREGNRERKKKWREENAERNKDNDLRCRVLKRAALKFGEGSSDDKLEWIEKEYLRRRTRRINRQKKDEVKAESPPPSDESSSHHPVLVKRISETFNLVTECGHDEDPSGVFMAVSSTVAVVASACAEELNITDSLAIFDLISLTLSSIFDQAMRSGASRKFLFLIKREDNQLTPTGAPEMTQEELFQKVSNLKNFNSSSVSTLDALRESQKRLGIDFLSSLDKRRKTSNETDVKDTGGQISESERDIFTSSSSVNSWRTTSGLKMPLYKTPGNVTDPELFKVDNSRREYVEPIPKITSPFISNKVGVEASSHQPSSLKKGGGLQRPGFSKPANRPNNIGFPTLYSTSFRLN